MENSQNGSRSDSTTTADRFQALVNGKPFVPQTMRALACLRTELEGTCDCKIWNVHAVGKVATDALCLACS